MKSHLSRRSLFSILARPWRSVTDPFAALAGSGVASGNSNPQMAEKQNRVAIIQGRFCLAYTSFCTVCSEHCPVAGAMRVDKGIPMVVADLCTGCGICHDVCPAPTNAVLVLPRRTGPRLGTTSSD